RALKATPELQRSLAWRAIRTREPGEYEHAFPHGHHRPRPEIPRHDDHQDQDERDGDRDDARQGGGVERADPQAAARRAASDVDTADPADLRGRWGGGPGIQPARVAAVVAKAGVDARQAALDRCVLAVSGR